jgi:hypothetical protein
MISGGAFEGSDLPSIEDTASWVADYFWSDLYKPYPGIEKQKPMAIEKAKDSIRLLISGDQEAISAWIKLNCNKFNSALRCARGDSLLMHWIKGRTNFLQGPPQMRQQLQSEMHSFETILEHWRKSIGMLAQQAPQQLNIADFKGQTPLMLMTEAGDAELVKLMLDAGADPEMQNYQGRTALHSAIKSRSSACVDTLLDHPCSTNKVTIDGQSVLHTAVKFGNTHAVNRLLSMTPELMHLADIGGATPLEMAEHLTQHPDSLKKLSDYVKRSGALCASKQELQKITKLFTVH